MLVDGAGGELMVLKFAHCTNDSFSDQNDQGSLLFGAGTVNVKY